MKDRYLLLGNPVEHSLSPAIHAQFADQTGQSIEYECRLVEVGEFDAAIRAIQKAGIAGANVTVPFKQAAYAVADESGACALKAGVANTLMFRADGPVYADNTDGVGLVNDIKMNHHYDIIGKRILIVGAGGAARGVLKSLIDERPASITIANRTASKAALLRDTHAEDFAISVCGFADLSGQRFELVINATSLGLQEKVAPLPPAIFAGSALAYDMMYGSGSLPFQVWAKQQGAALVLDGLGMLIEQAAASFYLWRGIRPDAGAVINDMRAGC